MRACAALITVAAGLALLVPPTTAERSASRHWCRHLPRWTAYWAGNAVGVHQATSASVDCFRGEGGLGPDGDVGYLYGDCHDYGDTGCPLPVEVDSAPLCGNRPVLYEAPGPRPKRERFRGVPAARFSDGRFEIYTRTTTIIVFARKQRLVRKAAKRVHPAPRYNLPRRHHEREHFRREPHPRRHYGRLPAPTRHQMRTKKDCG